MLPGGLQEEIELAAPPVGGRLCDKRIASSNVDVNRRGQGLHKTMNSPSLPVRYRLPTELLPESYNLTLWPRLLPHPLTGLYIFTGELRTMKVSDDRLSTPDL